MEKLINIDIKAGFVGLTEAGLKRVRTDLYARGASAVWKDLLKGEGITLLMGTGDKCVLVTATANLTNNLSPESILRYLMVAPMVRFHVKPKVHRAHRKFGDGYTIHRTHYLEGDYYHWQVSISISGVDIYVEHNTLCGAMQGAQALVRGGVNVLNQQNALSPYWTDDSLFFTIEASDICHK